MAAEPLLDSTTHLISTMSIRSLSAAAICGQPEDAARAGVVRIDLSGLDILRFTAVLGGDYPRGDGTQRRKTVASRVTGPEARFITIIEPSEKDPVVHRAEATSPDALRVELVDGPVQEFVRENFAGCGSDRGVSIDETRGGSRVREESTTSR